MNKHLSRILPTKVNLFYVIVFAILLLSFMFDIFGTVNSSNFIGNFKDSEALVTNEAVCNGKLFGGQLVLTKAVQTHIDSQSECTAKANLPYSSQFGLQGRLLAFAHNLFSPQLRGHAFAVAAEFALAIVSALMFLWLVIWVRRRYGLVVAGTVTAFVALSPMLVSFARNLYWMLPLLIAPFIYILFFYQRPVSTKQKVLFWGGLCALFMLKFLCGYEYVTTMPIMGMAAVGFFLKTTAAPLKRYIKELLIVGCMGVLGFALALGIHIAALTPTVGNLSRAVTIVKEDAFKRTANTSAFLQYPYLEMQSLMPDTYNILDSDLGLTGRSMHSSLLWSEIVSLITYALLPVVVVPIAFLAPFGTLVESNLVFVLLLVLLYRKRTKVFTQKQMNDVQALFLAATIGYVGFLSWLICAPSHSLVHPHINGILLYMPFALFGFVIIGIALENLRIRSQKLLKLAG